MAKKMESSAVKRAVQVWDKEKLYEPLIKAEYESLYQELQALVADIYASYEVDGEIPYNQLRVNLNQQEMVLYKRGIQQLIQANPEIDDDDILVELNKLMNYQKVSIIDAKMNTLEAHSLITIHNTIELVSQSLLETYDYTEVYTNYDIQREAETAWKIDKKSKDDLLFLLLMDDSWGGMTYPESLKASRHRLLRDIKRETLMGIKGKQSFPRLSKQLRKQVIGGKGSGLATNTLRDRTTATISKTAIDVYKKAGLDRYRFVATLDDRTTRVCQDLDGSIHKIDDAVEGVNLPKMHFNCRSTTAPYLPDEDLKESVRKARDPNNRQNYTISGDISFHEWNAKYNQ